PAAAAGAGHQRLRQDPGAGGAGADRPGRRGALAAAGGGHRDRHNRVSGPGSGRAGAGVQNRYEKTWRACKTPIFVGGTVTGVRRWHAGWAMLPGGPARDVLLEVEEGRFTAVTPDVPAEQATAHGVERLPGVVLPGLANCH